MSNVKRRWVWTTVALIVMASLAVGSLGSPAPAAGAARYDFSLLELCLDLIRTYYPGEWRFEDLVQSAAEGLVQGLGDPYSEYLTAQEYDDLLGGLSGGFGGIGIQIDEDQDGYIVIVAPLRGTPADLVGLRAGDKIAEVDGQDFRNVGLSGAKGRLRGEPGTKVNLGIIRAGVEGLLRFEITRAWIEVNPVAYKLLEDGIGYIELNTFAENATEKVDEAIAALKAQGAKGLVLDLRDNPGGLMDQAVELAERFLRPEQVILSIKYKSGEPRFEYASGKHFVGLPLAVLVNGGTASASEILAGAVKDNGMGTLVGTRTYGKGTIMNVWGFTIGGGLCLTSGRYHSPAGVAIEGNGIEPQEAVEPAAGPLDLPFLAWERPIRLMRVGLDVLALQEVLSYLGLASAEPDGVYSADVVKVVKSFQRGHGLFVTGIVDQSAADALNRAVLEVARQRAEDPQLERAVSILRQQIR